jgi:predicted permease
MQAWRDSGIFEDVEAAQLAEFRAGADASRQVAGARVTPGMFDLLGVEPIRGRTFHDLEGRPGSGDVVMLSEQLWRGQYGADPAILGARIPIDGVQMLVAGIMPATFRFPRPSTNIWTPFDPIAVEAGATTLFGRLAPGVPLRDAAARTIPLAIQFGRLPESYRPGSAPPLRPVGYVDLGAFAPRAIWLLFAGAVLVFLALCANAGGVLLGDLSSRRRELGICSAVGASRARAMRQLAIEYAFIATAGIAGGIGIAGVLTSAVPALFEGRSLNLIDVDLRAMLVACALGATAVVLAGLLPAWAGTSADPVVSLRSARASGTDTRGSHRAGRALVALEIALACALLAGSAGLARSLVNLVTADRGIDDAGIVRVRVSGLDEVAASETAMKLATEAIEARFAAWPVIGEVALSRDLPPGLTSNVDYVHHGPPGTRPDPADAIPSDRYRVGPSFLSLHGLPVLRGRSFDASDTPFDAIVGGRLAELMWPGRDPVGETFAAGSQKRGYRVIGVTREIQLPTLDRELDRPEFYTPLGWTSRTLYVSFRCRGACPSEQDVRAQVTAVHASLRASSSAASQNEYAEHLRLPRAAAQVAGVFGVVAVVAAAGGLFSVLTHAVRRRRREFGIRVALGASRGEIRWLVSKDTGSLVIAGIVAGAAGGWMIARGLAAFRYGVTAGDPLTWGSVLAVLGCAALAAAWRPTVQAMHVDPMTLLKEE